MKKYVMFWEDMAGNIQETVVALQNAVDISTVDGQQQVIDAAIEKMYAEHDTCGIIDDEYVSIDELDPDLYVENSENHLVLNHGGQLEIEEYDGDESGLIDKEKFDIIVRNDDVMRGMWYFLVRLNKDSYVSTVEPWNYGMPGRERYEKGSYFLEIQENKQGTPIQYVEIDSDYAESLIDISNRSIQEYDDEVRRKLLTFIKTKIKGDNNT